MKFSGILAAPALGGLLLLTSCVSPYAGPNESVGSVVGGGGGAIAGAIIGNQSHRPLEGAAIGGIIGALAGSAVGHAQDEYYGSAPPPPPPPRYYYAPRYYGD